MLTSPFLRKISLLPERANPERHPFSLPVFRNGFDFAFSTPLTVLTGENGSGKSTILELIAAHCGFSLGGGGRSHMVRSHESLDSVLPFFRFAWSRKVTDGFFLRAENFAAFANYIDEAGAGPGAGTDEAFQSRPLQKQSHGEGFISVFRSRFARRGIYLLDEPEAALSPKNQMVLVRLLHQMAGDGDKQIVIASHAPMLMGIPNGTTIVISDGGLEERNFTTSEHFKILRRFFADPDRFYESITKDE